MGVVICENVNFLKFNLKKLEIFGAHLAIGEEHII